MTKSQREVDQAAQIKQFLALKEKSLEELQGMLTQMHLDTEGEKEDLVRRIITAGFSPQSLTVPQALALRTSADPEAAEWVRMVNSWILPQDSNGRCITSKIIRREFTFTNRDGETYKLSCPCAPRPMKSEYIQKVLEKGWVSPLDNQIELIKTLSESPENYICYLIRKRDRNSKWYTMIHVQQAA